MALGKSALNNGTHLLIDCSNVPRDICLDDGFVLEVMASAAKKAGAEVLSQVRYHFGHNTPPGFATAILLDESHCTAHSYADLGLIAFDIFTCGNISPHSVFTEIQQQLDLTTFTIQEVARFPSPSLSSVDAAASLPHQNPPAGEEHVAPFPA